MLTGTMSPSVLGYSEVFIVDNIPNICEVEVSTSNSNDNELDDQQSNHILSSQEVGAYENSVDILCESSSNDDNSNEKSKEERKLALQCYNELSLNQSIKLTKSDLIQCKICEKKVTYGNILNHYRFHLGVKPFKCTFCQATFTRQHSLKYHLLIHYNKTRFVCDECGRHFRHPSHYKEHQRRHTGETPFHCTECSFKFKTRNTYKRHLLTKHNKLLTAQGISDAPVKNDEPKKPIVPRRKYCLDFLHQNIQAVAEYEKAQKEFEDSMVPISNTNKDNLQLLLEAAALTAFSSESTTITDD